MSTFNQNKPELLFDRPVRARRRGRWLLVAMLTLSAVAGVHYGQTGTAGVWRPGSGAQWVQRALSWNDFKTQDKSYFDEGLRLVDLEIANGKYTGVWRPGSGAQWIHPGLSWQEFKAKDADYFKQGLRVSDIEIVDGEYAALWRPGTGAQWIHPALTWQDFKVKDTAYFKQGLRVTDLEIVDGRYTAVWQPGTGAQWIHPGLTWQQFRTQDKIYFDQGLRVVDFEVGEGGYTGVWRPGTGAQWVWGGLCFDDFRTEDAIYFSKGLRLTTVELTSDPKAIYRLPFDDIDGWRVSNGNWDDAKPGHGGKKTGLQAFAWDFVFDSNNDGKGESGQNIRAARGGRVHVVVESESKNSYNSTDLCKDGVGNYVVIDHGDGTFGTYWHLSQNGVIPKVGDRVNRGDKIAISGHTGVSSTPHVHFDVRTGWNINYSKCNLKGTEMPSVRVLFEDKNHSCWIPRVGDKLVSNNN